MSDNELDNLFKEAADGFKAPNDPSAWQAMSSKLDQAGAAASFWNWKTISSLTAAGITGIAFILYLSTPVATTETNAASDVTLNQVIEKKPTDSKSAVNDNEATSASKNIKDKNDLGAGESNQSRSNVASVESGDKSESTLNSKSKDGQPENSIGVQVKASQHNAVSPTQLSREQNIASVTASSVTNKNEITSAESKSGKAALIGGVAVTEKSLDPKTSGGSGVVNQTSVTTTPSNNKAEITSTENKSGQAPLIAGVAVTEKSLDPKTSNGSVVENQTSVTATPPNNKAEITSSENKSGQAPLIAGVAVTEKSLDSKSSGDPVVGNENSNQSESNTKASQVQSKNSLVANDSLKKLEAEKKVITTTTLLSESEKQQGEEDKKSESINRFAVKLAIAPDYTTVKTATPNSMGINYGVLFEYRISKHWSVATGGIWSKKIYSAYDVEYGAYHADWVDGDCRMWDIPVNVYYSFSSSKPFSFYASLGLSSYLMKEENYVYYVETPYGTYDYPKQVKGENNEWFKTLNVSIGMQFRMSQSLSLQFEPTLKAPLAGVGEGEVSLVSLGAFFNLRYDIPFNKTRSNEE